MVNISGIKKLCLCANNFLKNKHASKFTPGQIMQHKNYVDDAKSFTTNRRSGFWASARPINLKFILPGIFTIYSTAKEEGNSALSALPVPTCSKMLYLLAVRMAAVLWDRNAFINLSYVPLQYQETCCADGQWHLGMQRNCSRAKKSAMSAVVLA